MPFLLAWHFPNSYKKQANWASLDSVRLGCHYATLWPDARAVVREAAAQLPTIRRRTESFHKTFYQSTLPYWMLDCLTSQAATIRHIGVVFRIANGDVFGYEGSNGCCGPTCTHVWGYEQSLARLFPDLEKEMRRIDFKHQQRADGGINNRTDVPSPPHPTGEKTFVDGHASCVLKAYREALNEPDDSFFKEYWPHVRRAVEYLVARDAATAGGTPDGTLKDAQDNTYDQALHGVTTFISGYYLAALRAGEEWAKRMGDRPTADRFHAIFLKGHGNVVKHCWNGEYFQQDLPDYLTRSEQVRPGEHLGEIGPGCMADQLLGQWWAHQLGLGYVLPKAMVQTALRSIFKYNWLTNMAGFKQAPRAFAGDGDKGLLVCTWPKGGRPDTVMLYSDEVWTGIEYQVAAHMIYEGMIEEGLCDRPRRPRSLRRHPPPANRAATPGTRSNAAATTPAPCRVGRCCWPLRAMSTTARRRACGFPADHASRFPLVLLRSGGMGQPAAGARPRRAAERDSRGRRSVRGRASFLAPLRPMHEAQATLDGASIVTTLAPASDGVEVTFATPVVVRAGSTLTIVLS